MIILKEKKAKLKESFEDAIKDFATKFSGRVANILLRDNQADGSTIAISNMKISLNGNALQFTHVNDRFTSVVIRPESVRHITKSGGVRTTNIETRGLDFYIDIVR